MAVTEAAQTPTAEAIREDAERVVDVYMSVEANDVVTIITDDEQTDQARVVADVCVDRGAWPVIMNNETQVRRGLADTLFPMAPPRNLHQAMVNSDEIIIITNLEWANTGSRMCRRSRSRVRPTPRSPQSSPGWAHGG
jgi:hypothetical protein